MSDVPDKKAWPARNPVMVSIDELKPHPKNSRRHSEAQVKVVAGLIREYGWTNPILIDAEKRMIAGHCRADAARLLSIDEVPCILATGWTEEQIRAYVIADNQSNLAGTWDREALRLELDDLGKIGVDLEGLGFSSDDLDEIFADARDGRRDPESTPALTDKPATRPGDIWVMGDHRLICGDACDAETVKALLAGEKPVLMVTDPPYGVNYDASWRASWDNFPRHSDDKVTNDDRADWREAYELFEGNVAYVWHSGLRGHVIASNLAECGFELRSQIIWVKQTFQLSRGNYHWQHEPCIYGVRKGKAAGWRGGRKQSTVWDIPNKNPMGGKEDDANTTHSTQKPVECMARPIRNNSKRGEAIYDPFVGSGTSIIAAGIEGRRCYAVELEPAFCDMAVERWQNLFEQEAVRESDGVSFNAAVKSARRRTKKRV